jgi:hypothetical protein
MDDLELEEQLDDCDAWLARNADLFLAASVHIQAVGMSLRPDLEQHDYGLAVTAIKFQDLLRAALVAEAEVLMSDVKPWPADSIQHLSAELYSEKLVHAFAAWRIAQRGRHGDQLLAAAAGDIVRQPIPHWTWRSPVGDYRARLVAPASISPSGPASRLVVMFFDADGERASGLGGQPVKFCGVESVVDVAGRAEFAAHDVVHSEEVLKLLIGAEQTEWRLE